MEPINRPKDIIDHIEALASEHGFVECVDESFYQAFLDLTQEQIEKLTLILMLDQERVVRQIASDKPEVESQERISQLLLSMFTALSTGLAQFDPFGNFGFVARVGEEPSEEMEQAIERKFELIKPIIGNVVRRTLPWLLSREVTQAQLPL